VDFSADVDAPIRTYGGGMDRKVAGVLALVLAVSAALFVPRLISPGLAGLASAAPMPAPPAVGTCVNTANRPVRMVACDLSHTGEITATWAAEDPARAVEATLDRCDIANGAYTAIEESPELNGWTVVPPFWETQLVRAPRAQRVGDYGWQACVIRAVDRALYTGSVRNLDDMADRPDAFGSCQAADFSFVVCTEPHGSEVLAFADGIWYDLETGLAPGSRIEVIHDDIQDGCLTVAEALTGSSDPTYAGRLRVEVWVDQVHQQQVTYDDVRYATSYRASCQLTAVDGELIGSVVGVGDTELPLR